MNTTSSIFKEPTIYTVVDQCMPKQTENALSVAILPRGNAPFFSDLVQELIKLNPQELILFNTNFKTTAPANQMRHIWIPADLSPGEMVNIAIREAHGKLVFVLWSNQEFSSQDVSSQVFWRIEERGDLCTVPQLYDQGRNPLPVQSVPAFDRIGFRVIRTLSEKKDIRIFTPFDYSGVYNRAHFINLGGYDATIKNPYWQKNDFSMRAALWGERIVLNAALNLYCNDTPPIDNEAFDLSSRIFALKSLGISSNKKGVYLPLRRFFWVFGIRKGWLLFREIRSWVYENRGRFHYDVQHVVENWPMC